MKRRDLLKVALAASFVSLSALNSGGENPKEEVSALEVITKGIDSLGEGVVSIFQPEITKDIYALTPEGNIRKVEEEPQGLKLNIYGIDGSFIPPLKTYLKRALTRNQIGYAVQNVEDVLILDAGAKLILEDEEVLKKADAILLSHIHPDHILYFWNIQKKIDKNAEIYSPTRVPNAPNLSKRIPDAIKSFKIEHTKTMHSALNFAYKIKAGKKVICYTGDMNYTDKVAEFCRGSDILLTELTNSNWNLDITQTHMSPREVIKLAKKAKPKLLVLTHFNHVDPDDCEAIVKKEFPNVIAAKPGMTFVIE